MIPVCQDEILTHPVGTNFTLQLHVEIKFHSGKAGQFSTLSWLRFACILLEFLVLKLGLHCSV